MMLIIKNLLTGATTTCPFQIARTHDWCPVGPIGCCPPQMAPAGTTIPFALSFQNNGDPSNTLSLTFRVASSEGFDGTLPFMLNGLPAGEPASVLLKGGPGDTATATVEVSFLQNDPTQVFELQLIGDEDHDGTRELLAAVPLIAAAPVASLCASDFNGDGMIDGGDLAVILAEWGSSGPGDLNGDGTVDGADLGKLLGSWGPCSNG
jgi:hypothetical protein